MKTKSSQNKIIKLLKMPIRALAKARDFYVRTMNKYADSGTYDGLGWGGPVYVEHMPRSQSTSAMRTVEADRVLNEQLVRAASTGALGNRLLLTSLLGSANNSTNKGGVISALKTENGELGGVKGVPRSGSVVMAKIEEDVDEPSNETSDDVGSVDKFVEKSKSKIRLFPRSNSKAFGETRRITVVL